MIEPRGDLCVWCEAPVEPKPTRKPAPRPTPTMLRREREYEAARQRKAKKKRQVARMLAEGRSYGAIALAAGVHRKTIYDWVKAGQV